jgi:hypothetical protein
LQAGQETGTDTAGLREGGAQGSGW